MKGLKGIDKEKRKRIKKSEGNKKEKRKQTTEETSEKAQKNKKRKRSESEQKAELPLCSHYLLSQGNRILNTAVGQPESGFTSAYCTFITKKLF
jgi:hypothetical protein